MPFLFPEDKTMRTRSDSEISAKSTTSDASPDKINKGFWFSRILQTFTISQDINYDPVSGVAFNWPYRSESQSERQQRTEFIVERAYEASADFLV
ncbi:hypothetical protein O9G_005224 [Rozella allomycis CSF55]|uniref:Uncharacterized protein n=1 Tax=Rozella allomycis (strain CSF55) TaxID=988480 RepID=A0A075AMS3_ROZAC|nr:hypothetical protein O9G_005224 [Rozella allomycis CSF55]|eukprot:EPZ30958.1 hypothetical protein O9G_005224 [Rozella allomycis CSF55]